MKKGSGFEKFFKGKEKTGGAKKESIRQEKRQVRKEREEEIAAHKRKKRAQFREASSGQPPKYNLEPPTSRFQKKDSGQRGKPSFSVEKKGQGFQPRKSDSSKPKEQNRRHQQPGNEGKSSGQQKSFKDNRKPYPDKRTNERTGKPDERKGFDERNKPQRFKNKEAEARPPRTTDDERQRTVPNIVKKNVAKPKIGAGMKPVGERAAAQQTATATTGQMPLNKFIAHSGVCSRRDAVDLIKAGKVKVNGTLVLEPGHKVELTDDVSVTGKHLKPVKDFIYILLNKPKDYITTTEDPQERKTVLDLLKGAPQTRIYPVGRLDRNTSGVLLLTNDGDLSQKLTHPSNEIKKVYAVTLDKPLTKHDFDEILRGVQLDDGPANVDVLAYADAKDHTQIGVELHGGRNRIVRRIFESLDYDVKALDRVVFAGLTKKNVNRGKWRFLTEKEVRDLKFFKRGR